MKKKKHISIIGWLFYGASIAVFTLGFIGLFSRDFGFEMPILSQYYPIFDKHTVSTPGWASPGHTTEVVVGHHWVFLICLGISIVLAIIGKSINSLIYYLVVTRKRKIAAAKRRAQERKERQAARDRTASNSGFGGQPKKSKGQPENSNEREAEPDKSKGKEQNNAEAAEANDDSVTQSSANEAPPNFAPPKAKAQKPAAKKEPEPEPEGQHKSFAELTKSVSDIIQ